MEPIELFIEKFLVDDNGCWVWKRPDCNGYGGFSNRGVRVYAHRWSYQFFVGPIPEGLEIDHLCRNRACVNPDHLEPVTSRVNVLRGIGVSAMNSRKTHCVRGHPFSGNNLAIRPDGGRTCLACRRMYAAQHYYRTSDDLFDALDCIAAADAVDSETAACIDRALRLQRDLR